MFSDDEEMPVKDQKVEKQILNIKQIANSRKISSLQEGYQHSPGWTHYEQVACYQATGFKRG